LVDGVVVGRVSRIPIESERRSGSDSSECDSFDERFRRVPSEVVVGRDGEVSRVSADVERADFISNRGLRGIDLNSE
jgi:hypothetical protein